jgi:hypothetical protein
MTKWVQKYHPRVKKGIPRYKIFTKVQNIYLCTKYLPRFKIFTKVQNIYQDTNFLMRYHFFLQIPSFFSRYQIFTQKKNFIPRKITQIKNFKPRETERRSTTLPEIQAFRSTVVACSWRDPAALGRTESFECPPKLCTWNVFKAITLYPGGIRSHDPYLRSPQ